MKLAFRFSILCSLVPVPNYLLAIPTVSNVTAAQRQDQSKLIDIHYDLAATAPCIPGAPRSVVSADGGATWNIPAIPPRRVSPGPGKAVLWDAGAAESSHP